MSADTPAPILVTGASSGIGLACATHLAGHGHAVLAGVRKEADAERLAAIDRVEPLILDVTSPHDLTALRERLAGQALAGLVNNAGIAVPGPLEELPLDDLRRQFEVNVFSAIAVTQAALGALRAGGGRVVNIGSIGGRVGQPFVGAYCGSKAAIHVMSASLRAELAPWDIWVACVEPGTIDTDIWGKGESEAEQILAGLSEDGRRRYGARLERMRDLVGRQNRRAIGPEAVAERVEHALTADRPRAYYLVGADARFLDTAERVLPARARDGLMGRLLGL